MTYLHSSYGQSFGKHASAIGNKVSWALSAFSLRFKDPDIEHAFLQTHSPHVRKLLLFGISIVFVTELGAQLYNMLSGLNPHLQVAITSLRAGILLILGMSAIILYRTHAARTIFRLSTICIVTFTLYKLANMSIHDSFSAMNPLNLVGYLMALFVFMPMMFTYQLALGLVYTAISLFIWSPAFLRLPEFPFVLLWIASAFAVGIYVARNKHISDRRIYQSQQQLLQQNKSLEQSNHYNAVLVNVLSHEVLNPLHALSNKIELWRRSDHSEGNDNSAQSDSRFIIIQQLARKAMHTLNQWTQNEKKIDALAYSQRSDLLALIYNSVAEFSHLHPNILVKIQDPKHDLPALNFEPRVLSLVLSNILNNVQQHTNASIVSIQFRFHIASVKIRIRDNGQGIRHPDPNIVFVKYHSEAAKHLKSTDNNQGLGLYISRELLQQTGADIEVQSELGKGSAFSIVLPIAIDD